MADRFLFEEWERRVERARLQMRERMNRLVFDPGPQAEETLEGYLRRVRGDGRSWHEGDPFEKK